MTYLGPEELSARLAKDLKLDPEPAAHGWDLNLQLGDEAFVSSGKKVVKLGGRDSVPIEPGEFALLLTRERITMPHDLVGFISVKFKWKAKGLTNVSGFHVDPNYDGHLIFCVYNAGPKTVHVRRGDSLFMIGFSKLDRDKQEEVDATRQGYDHIPSDMVTHVMGPPVSVLQLDQRIRKLERVFSQWGFWIVQAVVIAVSGLVGYWIGQAP